MCVAIWHFNVCVCVRARVCVLLTSQEALTLLVPQGVGVTLLRSRGSVALRDGHDGGPVADQELTQVPVVTGSRAVQRGPGGWRPGVTAGWGGWGCYYSDSIGAVGTGLLL